MSLARTAVVLAGLACLSACEATVPAPLEPGWRRLQGIYALLIAEVTGRPMRPSPTPSSSAGPAGFGPQARIAQESAELLNEMYSVVLGAPATNRVEFGALLNSLVQGASLEGIYNGLTLTENYRRREMGSGSAAPRALKDFIDLVVDLEAQLSTPTVFDARSAQPLARIGGPEEGGEAPSRPRAVPASPGPQTSDQIAALFVGASIFTLKRVAADEAVKVIEAKRKSRDQLAGWYGPWATRQAARGVDFGLALRNKADERFHFDSAFKMSEDRLTWEVLNRVHRILNTAESRR